MGLLTGKWFVVGPGREPTPEVTRRQLESRLTFGTEAEGRYELDDRGLRLYDSAGNLVANLKSLDGTAMFGDEDGTRVFIDPTRAGSVLFFNENMDAEGVIRGDDGALYLEAPHDTGNPFSTVHLLQGTGAAVLLQPLLKLAEQSTPGTPTADTVIVYVKDKAGTSALYFKNDAGTEYELGGGSDGALVVQKLTETQVVNNSTTLVDDDTLQFAIGANEEWSFKMVVFSTSATAADFKSAITGPAGMSGRVVWAGFTPAGSLTNNTLALPSGAISTIGLTAPRAHTYEGTALAAGTAGTVKLQWAQDTADVSDTRVNIGSFLIAHQGT